MLDEIELLIARRDPEVRAFVGNSVSVGLSVGAYDCEAALLAEWRIRKNHVHCLSLGFETVRNGNGRMSMIRADTVEEEVHGAQARDIGHKLDSLQCSGA